MFRSIKVATKLEYRITLDDRKAYDSTEETKHNKTYKSLLTVVFKKNTGPNHEEIYIDKIT